MEAKGSAFHSRPRGTGTSSRASNADRTAAGASKFLADLPSCGLFSSTVLSSSTLAGIRVYICDHETAPPEGQLIKTDTTNILIRALRINKKKTDLKDVTAKKTAESSTGKRSTIRTSEGRNPAKKLKTSLREVSSTGFSERMLQAMTVEQLRALLKERGLSPKGKKDELIARLMAEA